LEVNRHIFLLLSAYWYKIKPEIKKVAKRLLDLPYIPARTLNDFFAGFFISVPEPGRRSASSRHLKGKARVM